MAKRLLDRQVALAEYMTSAAAIFRDQSETSMVPALQGIDCGLLQVEARFSYAKRMEKVTAVLPKTFELMGARQAQIVREFIASCPPTSISRLANARQFHDFLASRESCDPPYLCDVAACEIAYAEVDAADHDDGLLHAERQPSTAQRGVRRCPAVVLLQCAYDVRSIFEVGAGTAAPAKRKTELVVAQPPAEGHPRVFEVPSAVFALLRALDDWTDPLAVEVSPELTRLLDDLAQHGLIEVRG